jgi:hypothetical protein
MKLNGREIHNPFAILAVLFLFVVSAVVIVALALSLFVPLVAILIIRASRR